MAKCIIEFEDIDNGKYRVIDKPDVMKIVQKHKNGHQLTPAEAKFLLAMATTKKAIIQESVDAQQKQSPLVLR